MTEHETAREAHFRLLRESKARQNRNWFTRHDLPLLMGCAAAAVLANYLMDKTADGSASAWFLLAVVWVAAIGAALLAPLTFIELWHTIRGSLYVHRLLKQEREGDR